MLRRDQLALASLFGEETGDDTDKLANVAWREGLADAPILAECSTWLEGVVLERFPLGDHVGYLLEVIDVGLDTDHETMLKSAVMDLEPGHPADEIGPGNEPAIETLK